MAISLGILTQHFQTYPYMKRHPPKLECCIVRLHSFQKPEQNHHFAARCVHGQPKLECMTSLPATVECHIFHLMVMSASHRLVIAEKHRRPLAEGRWPKPGCRRDPPRAETLQVLVARLPELGRHCGEAGYASSLQKLGCNAFG